MIFTQKAEGLLKQAVEESNELIKGVEISFIDFINFLNNSGCSLGMFGSGDYLKDYESSHYRPCKEKLTNDLKGVFYLVWRWGKKIEELSSKTSQKLGEFQIIEHFDRSKDKDLKEIIEEESLLRLRVIILIKWFKLLLVEKLPQLTREAILNREKIFIGNDWKIFLG